MKPQNSRKVRKHLKAAGWVLIRDAQGSHEIWGLPDESVKQSIPFGHAEISAGVLQQLERKGLKLPKEWR